MAQAANFQEISARLDEIVTQVRSKDVSLETSLDLFDEAIKLGSQAVDLVDATDFTPEEALALSEGAAGDTGAETEDHGQEG